MEQYIPFAIPVLVALGAGFGGHAMARAGHWRAIGILAAVLLVVTGLQWMRAQGASNGWDGIADFLLVALILAPVLIGLVVGAGIGRARGRRTK